MDVQWLLDEARRSTGVSSDSRLAERLGVTRQAVNFWRKGRALPDVVSCEKLADFCGIPPLQVVAEINEMRAATHAEKQLWRRLAISVLVSLFVAIPAHSKEADGPNLNEGTHYALCEVFTDGFARRLGRLWLAGQVKLLHPDR